MSELENLTAGNDEECGWAAAEYVATGVAGILSGGWGLLLLPFALRKVLVECDLI